MVCMYKVSLTFTFTLTWLSRKTGYQTIVLPFAKRKSKGKGKGFLPLLLPLDFRFAKGSTVV